MYCKSCGAEMGEHGKCSVCGKRASALSTLVVIMCIIALIASGYAVAITNGEAGVAHNYRAAHAALRETVGGFTVG